MGGCITWISPSRGRLGETTCTDIPHTSASLFGQQYAGSSDGKYANWSASQFKAAQFLRLAESKGNKTLGNTWYVYTLFSYYLFREIEMLRAIEISSNDDLSISRVIGWGACCAPPTLTPYPWSSRYPRTANTHIGPYASQSGGQRHQQHQS